VLKQLAELRSYLDVEEANVIDPAHRQTQQTQQHDSEDLGPVALLEASLSAFDNGKPRNPQEWNDWIRQARIYLQGARAEFNAIKANKGDLDRIQRYAERLGMAQGRLAGWERLGPPRAAVIPSRDPPVLEAGTRWDELLNLLIERLGTWATSSGSLAAQINRVVVHLDGINEKDELAAYLAQICTKANVPVVSFDVACMPHHDRIALYGSLDRLRTATPLAIADVVLTLDGRTELAGDLAREVKGLGQPGKWDRDGVANLEGPDWLNLDNTNTHQFYDRLRRHYVAESAEIIAGSEVKTKEFACAYRLVSALGALAMWDENEGRKLQEGTARLMGGIFCFDRVRSPTIEQTLADASVQYVPNAAGGGLDRWLHTTGKFEGTGPILSVLQNAT
jgi:hypothetical protein